MATKQQKVVQRAVAKERNRGKEREERHLLWLLVALILILLYLLAAQHYAWWPFSQPKLGTAFYTNVEPNAPKPASQATTQGISGSASSSSTNAQSSTKSSGSTPTTTPTTTSTSSIPSIANFAAGVNVGDTKVQTSGQANGLNQACAIVVNANDSTLGQQQVCTYTEGNDIVTVTYLNNHVISASKSGF